MEIAENNAQRITLVEKAAPLEVILLLCFVFLGAILAGIGARLLFGQVSELVAPAWAESHRLSGRRWYNEGSVVPLSLASSGNPPIFNGVHP